MKMCYTYNEYDEEAVSGGIATSRNSPEVHYVEKNFHLHKVACALNGGSADVMRLLRRQCKLFGRFFRPGLCR